MRTRRLVLVLSTAILASILPTTTANAANKLTLSVVQEGTSVTAKWKYSGSSPASQRLVVTPVIPEPAPTTETTEGTTSGDTTTATTPTTTPSATPAATGPSVLELLAEETRNIKLTRGARSAKVTDLLPGAKYTFTIVSTKPALKVTKTITLAVKPVRASGLSLVWSGKELLAVWNYDGPAVKNWGLTYSASDGKTTKTVKSGSALTTARLTGLSKTLGYTVSVYGINAAGNGPKVAETVLQVAPNAPSNLTVNPANAEGDAVTIGWDYDGPAVTSFKVQAKSAGQVRDLDVVTTTGAARSVVFDKLGAGAVYTFVVSAVNSQATTSATTAAYTAVKPLAAPTNLTGTAGNLSVVLKWTAPVADTTNPITGYRVEYAAAGATPVWNSVAIQGAIPAYTVTGLTNGESYRFRVVASTAKGNGLTSTEIAVIAGQAPGAPSGLKLVPAAKSITVTWNDPTAVNGTIVGYAVEYKKSTDTTWSKVADVTTRSATITGLVGTSTYNVRVAVIGESGQGAFSPVATGAPIDAPAAPVVTVTSTAGSRRADLKWPAPANNGSPIISYKVEQQTGDGVWTPLSPTAPITTTSYSVSNLTPTTTYKFRVSAINIIGSSELSNEVSILITAAPELPVVTATAGSGQVVLTWSEAAANGSPVTGYRVERSTGTGSWSVVADNLTALTYTSANLTNGTPYNFRVSAKNAIGTGLPSATVTATPVTTPGVLSGFMIEPNVEEIRVKWTLPATTPLATGGSALLGIKVSYRAAGGSWILAPGGLVSPTAIFTDVSDLIAGVTYEFKAVAVNAVGDGVETAVKSGVPYAAPQAPTDLAAVGKDGSVELTWKAPQLPISSALGSAYKYLVEYSIDNITWIVGADAVAIPTAENPRKIENLRNGVPYFFRISAGYTVAGKVSYGEVATISATPRGTPGAPESLTATQLSATSVRLSWVAPSNSGGGLLTGYDISYTSNGTSWLEPALTTQSTTIDINDLVAGLPYTFRVRVNNTFTSSAWVTRELTPVAVPSAVSGLSVRQIANGAVTIGWNGNPSSESVSGYRIEYTAGGGIWTLAAANETTNLYTVTGLAGGTTYTFRVSARNVAGFGVGATVIGKPFGPLPITGLAATAGDAKVDLRWTSPADGGSTVTGIRVRYSTDLGQNWSVAYASLAASATTATVSSLTNAQSYLFEVVVLTNAGDSTASTVSATPVSQLATVPQNLTQVMTANTAALTWQAPASSGVGTVSYRVEYKLTSSATWTTATTGLSALTYTINNLTAVTSYDFRVFAVNAAGDSPAATATDTTAA